MRKITILLLSGLLGSIAWAQTQPPGVISRAPASTNTFVSGGATFTNQSGAIYSSDQLATQLQSLRTIVDQMLPALTAYTETVSNTATTGNRSVVSTISDILAGALNRNAQNQGGASGQSSTTNGVARVLQGLLGTNTTTSASGNTTMLRDLESLQNELQSVEATLQRLNISTSTNWGLTPTGR